METFISGIQKADQAQQSTFIKKLKEEGKGEMLAQSVIYDLVTRAGHGTADAIKGVGGSTLWNRAKMDSNLKSQKQFLIRALGKDRYENLVRWNQSLKWLEGKALPDEIRGSATTTTKGKVAAYFSNLPAAVATRFKSAMLYSQLNNPLSFKIVKSAEDYDKIMNRVVMNTLISKDGIQAIASEAENDPEFKAKMAEFYSEVFQEQ